MNNTNGPSLEIYLLAPMEMQSSLHMKCKLP